MQFLDDHQLPQKTNGGDSIFVKLEDGESVVGVFYGDPEHANVKFDRVAKKWIKDPTAFRFRLNLVIEDQGVLVSKIYEGGSTVYTQLRELHKTGYTLPTTKVKLTRKGTGTDTVYTILPLPQGTLTAKEAQKYSSVPLKDLKWKL